MYYISGNSAKRKSELESTHNIYRERSRKNPGTTLQGKNFRQNFKKLK